MTCPPQAAPYTDVNVAGPRSKAIVAELTQAAQDGAEEDEDRRGSEGVNYQGCQP